MISARAGPVAAWRDGDEIKATDRAGPDRRDHARDESCAAHLPCVANLGHLPLHEIAEVTLSNLRLHSQQDVQHFVMKLLASVASFVAVAHGNVQHPPIALDGRLTCMCVPTFGAGFSATPVATTPRRALCTMQSYTDVPLEDRLTACMNADGCDIDMMAGASVDLDPPTSGFLPSLCCSPWPCLRSLTPELGVATPRCTDLLKELRIEAVAVKSRMDQINNLIKYLETIVITEDSDDFTGMSLTEAAQKCVEDGCAVDTTNSMVARLMQASYQLQANGDNHDYVDQLIGVLNTQLDRAGTAGRTAGQF